MQGHNILIKYNNKHAVKLSILFVFNKFTLNYNIICKWHINIIK